VANFVVGKLEVDKESAIFLLHSEELKKTNHSIIFQLFNKAMGILWPTGVQHDNVVFKLYAAPYIGSRPRDCNTNPSL